MYDTLLCCHCSTGYWLLIESERMMSMLSGGAVVAALAFVAVLAKMRRRYRAVAGLQALRGKVVLITGASSGLGEGN